MGAETKEMSKWEECKLGEVIELIGGFINRRLEGQTGSL